MRRLALALVIAVSACAQPAQVAVDSSLTVETFADTGNEHFPDTEVQAILAGTSDFSYSTFPATSGPHAATWAPCGIYRETVPEIFDVHTMEHGGVVVHYDPSLPTDQRDSIENLARELGSHILVTPRPGLPAEVVLTAWTVMADLDGPDLTAIETFWHDYAEKGPERVECPLEVDQASG